MKTELKVSKQKYSLEKLVRSSKFAIRRDLLKSLVKDGEEITITEANQRIEKFLKGEK